MLLADQLHFLQLGLEVLLILEHFHSLPGLEFLCMQSNKVSEVQDEGKKQPDKFGSHRVLLHQMGSHAAEVVLVDDRHVVQEPVHPIGRKADDAHHTVELVLGLGFDCCDYLLDLVEGLSQSHQLSGMLEPDCIRRRVLAILENRKEGAWILKERKESTSLRR